MKLTISEIIKATQGNLLTGSPEKIIDNVSIDSRRISAGSLFIPLKGEKCDGHIFIDAAFNQGATASLLRKGNPVIQRLKNVLQDKILIEVEEPLKALGDIARWWRDKFSATIVAITGSNGKTTTKELLWNIISEKTAAIKNPGNWNNLIGLPLSLFQLNATMKVAVLEMGMSEKGEIGRLTEICKPQIGLITNIGPCHLETLTTLEDVAEAKAELFERLESSDIAIINKDDFRAASLAERTHAEIVSFGVEKGDIHALNIRSYNCCGAEFDLNVMGEKTTVRLKSLGKQFLSNALAAAAIAHTIGSGTEEIRKGLESFTGIPGRMETINLGGVQIINDAYNANPVSMQASLSALSSITTGNHKIAVLGDMLELGPQSIKFHTQIGEKAAGLNIDHLFLIGDFSSFVRKGAVSGGMNSKNITVCDNLKNIADILKNKMVDGDSILLKGSRKMEMEKIIELLKPKLSDSKKT